MHAFASLQSAVMCTASLICSCVNVCPQLQQDATFTGTWSLKHCSIAPLVVKTSTWQLWTLLQLKINLTFASCWANRQFSSCLSASNTHESATKSHHQRQRGCKYKTAGPHFLQSHWRTDLNKSTSPKKTEPTQHKQTLCASSRAFICPFHLTLAAFLLNNYWKSMRCVQGLRCKHKDHLADEITLGISLMTVCLFGLTPDGSRRLCSERCVSVDITHGRFFWKLFI